MIARLRRRLVSGAVGALALGVVLAWMAAHVNAQTPQPPAIPAQPAPAPPPAVERVTLTAGRSTVVATDFDVVRIAVTNPAIADAVVVQPREILVDGKS